MDKNEIQKLITELIEKTTVKLNEVEVNEPHFFISHDGEGLQALNHIVHRIIEAKNPSPTPGLGEKTGLGILVDVNGFQKKHVENVRAVAHMMSERARYFKSNIEIDPMSAFERRIVHEFLSDAPDLKTESMGMGRDRRVVIKYIGNM
jgi:spoIIIJ-associated protein